MKNHIALNFKWTIYMRHLITFSFLLFFCATFLKAQTEESVAVQAKSKANISFTEEVYDFGDIDEGPKVTHQFKFKNTGTEPLVLSKVTASCGCTIPEWPKQPILPGEESNIDVTYNTQGRVGNFNKAITIQSNASLGTKAIYIKGKVLQVEEVPTQPVKEKSILTPDNN